EEIRGGVGDVSERAFVLRQTGAKLQLIAVLLLEMPTDVDSIGARWRLLDVQLLIGSFQRLEISELVQPPDAVLERRRVEDAALDEPQLAPDHRVARQ